MKRISTVVIAVFLLLSFTLPCCAHVKYDTAYDLFQVWSGPQAFPDYVSGVWCTDGNTSNLTIAVLKNDEGEKGKEEILELIEDDSSVTFTYGQYSRNYLTYVQKEVDKHFKNHEEHGLIGTALLEKEGKIGLHILKEYKDNKKTGELLTDLTSQYGDIFTLTYGDAFIEQDISITTNELIAPIENNNVHRNYPSLSTIVLVLILISSIAFMIVRKKRAKAMRTNSGEIVTSTAFTEKQVEQEIENASIHYPQTLDTKISEKIDEIK